MTDDELRAEYVRAMGPDLGQLFHMLRSELWWLRYKWNVFQELFEKGPERINLLDRVAVNFFYLLRQLLYENVMLHLARLTDNPKIKGRETLTIKRLAPLIPDEALRICVRTAEQEVLEKCGFARAWRNKWLAHTDLAISRNRHTLDLPSVEGKNIEGSLRSICALLNSVEEHYHLRPSLSMLSDPWGAESLVHHLEKSIQRGSTPVRPDQLT